MIFLYYKHQFSIKNIIYENIIHYITADQTYYLPVCRDCSMKLFFTNLKILMHSANHKEILTVFRNSTFSSFVKDSGATYSSFVRPARISDFTWSIALLLREELMEMSYSILLAEITHRIDLILHQGNQRRNHNGRAVHQQRG